MRHRITYIALPELFVSAATVVLSIRWSTSLHCRVGKRFYLGPKTGMGRLDDLPELCNTFGREIQARMYAASLLQDGRKRIQIVT
jgi:hypothetical protein